MAPKRAVVMHPLDNVATAIESVQAGEEVAVPAAGAPLVLRASEEIPFGFKIALTDIPSGEIIRKYGATIGRASAAIAKGSLVHIHNLEGTRARGDLEGRAKQ
jgi:altronate dehydratase small subunit